MWSLLRGKLAQRIKVLTDSNQEFFIVSLFNFFQSTLILGDVYFFNGVCFFPMGTGCDFIPGVPTCHHCDRVVSGCPGLKSCSEQAKTIGILERVRYPILFIIRSAFSIKSGLKDNSWSLNWKMWCWISFCMGGLSHRWYKLCCKALWSHKSFLLMSRIFSPNL